MFKDKNRYLLVAVILVVFLIIFSASIFFSSNTTIQTKDTVTVRNEATVEPRASTNQANPTPNKVSMKIYQANTYNVRYPSTWSVDANESSADQNNFLALQPEGSSQDSSHIAVEINDASTTSVDKMSSGLSLLGFRKQNAVVAGISAQKYSGAIILSGKSLHNTAYLFEHNNAVYLIKLSYEGPYNSQLEGQFTNFIDTFTLN